MPSLAYFFQHTNATEAETNLKLFQAVSVFCFSSLADRSLLTVALMLPGYGVSPACLSVVCDVCTVLWVRPIYRIRKSYMRNRLIPKWMTLTFV